MFTSFDIYGKQVSFTVSGNPSFQTTVGSCFSALTLALTIFCFLLFGSDLFYKENPFVVDQTTQPLQTTPLYFNSGNYTVVFSFGDDYFNFDPKGYFDISIHNEYIDNFNGNLTSKSIALRKCNEFDMRNYLGLYQQGHFYCFDIDSFNLNGSWTENYLSRIKFVVNRCKNTTNSATICKSDEIITKKIQDDVYFNIYTEDNSVNTENFAEPFSNYIKDIYWLLDNNLGKHAEVFLKKVSVETDSGIFLSSKNTDFMHKFEHYDLDVVSNLNPINRTYPLMKLILYASAHTQLIKRVYPKIQMVAAEVSGIVKIASIVIMSLLSVYTSYSLTIYLIKSEFDNTKGKSNRLPNDDLKIKQNAPIIKTCDNHSNRIQRMNENGFNEDPKFKKIELSATRSKQNSPDVSTVRGLNWIEMNRIMHDRSMIECIPMLKNQKGEVKPSSRWQYFFSKFGFFFKFKNKRKSGKIFQSSHKLKPMFNENEEPKPISKNISGRKSIMINQLESYKKNGVALMASNKSTGFQFSFWDYLTAKYCFSRFFNKRKKLNKKLKMFQKAQITISSYFDARILIRRIIDIERMKKLLFTEEQMKVYEFLTKPKLFYEKKEKGTTFTINDISHEFVDITEKKIDEKIEGVEAFYKRMMKEENPCHVDRKLYNMLDAGLKE